MADGELVTFKDFYREFWRMLYYLKSIIAMLLIIIALIGIGLSYVEGLPMGDAVYFAFITAFTVGYGDISPKTGVGRVTCAFILPVLGMILTGIIVAVAVQAVQNTYAKKKKEVKR